MAQTILVDPTVRILYNDSSAVALDKICEMAKVTRYDKALPHDRVRFVKSLMRKGHWTPLECISVTFHIVCDRAVANALTRHRHISACQESTHYNNLKGKRFKFIKYKRLDKHTIRHYEQCAEHYEAAVNAGWKPEEARILLPLGFATELMLHCNLRELVHILNLRSKGTTGKDQTDMSEVADEMLRLTKNIYPWVVE